MKCSKDGQTHYLAGTHMAMRPLETDAVCLNSLRLSKNLSLQFNLQCHYM